MIATNNHVVSDATSLTVGFADDTTAKATVVGTDSSADLAVISVKIKDIKDSTASKIKVATLGSSDDLKVGEEVVAIGNALGYGQSVTTGVVSAKNREVSLTDGTMNLLQTDAAINQGNSGGGLFRESDGTLIGIVNAKSSGSGIEGLGFAIPSTLAREVIGNLMDYGFVVGRPYLGVSTQDVSLSGYGFFTSTYTYPCIVSVEDGSAAQQAGLKKDDVIMAVNGDTVSSSDGLYIAVSKFKVGDTVTLTILRSNSQIDVSVTLGQRSTAKTAE